MRFCVWVLSVILFEAGLFAVVRVEERAHPVAAAKITNSATTARRTTAGVFLKKARKKVRFTDPPKWFPCDRKIPWVCVLAGAFSLAFFGGELSWMV
jgi:hypothetical protein